MEKFVKGYTYIVKRQAFFYLVQQTGMKTWFGMRFSHVSVAPSEFTVFTGNGEKLYELLEPTEVHKFDDNKALREAMFNILRTGNVSG